MKFETCENFCYTLWKENRTGNGVEITIIMQGKLCLFAIFIELGK